MIGQERNINRIKAILSNNPNTCFIIVGPKHMGKKTLVNHIIKKEDMINPRNVDELRVWMPINSLFMSGETLCFFDAEEKEFYRYSNLLCAMIDSLNNLPIFITTETMKHVPETLLSRSVVITMSPYTKEELQQGYDIDDIDILNYAESPGKILLYQSNGFSMLKKVCLHVVENLGIFPAGDCFYIVNKMLEEGSWKIELFLEVVCKLLIEKRKKFSSSEKFNQKMFLYIELYQITLDAYIKVKSAKGLHLKKQILDFWILNYRKVCHNHYGKQLHK